MKSYDSSLVSFLSHQNNILLTDGDDFDKLKEICKKIGLDLFRGYKNYFDLYADNRRYICRQQQKNLDYDGVIIEYDNYKGLTYGWTLKESIEWFDIEPIRVADLLKEL